MARNNENAVNGNLIRGDLAYTLRAELFVDANDTEDIFDVENRLNEAITQVVSFPVINASLTDLVFDESYTPGLYIGIDLGNNAALAITLPETELLKALANIQRMKAERDDRGARLELWDQEDVEIDNEPVGTFVCCGSDCCKDEPLYP